MINLSKIYTIFVHISPFPVTVNERITNTLLIH